MNEQTAPSDEQTRIVLELVRRAGLVAESDPEPVADSLLNANFRVETDGGPRFARIYRPELTAESVAEEHEITAWAASQGIPGCRHSRKRDDLRLHCSDLPF